MSEEQEPKNEPNEEVIEEVIIIKVWEPFKKAIANPPEENDSNPQNHHSSIADSLENILNDLLHRFQRQSKKHE